MKKLFYILLMMLLAAPLCAVEISNKSSIAVNLVDFSFMSGKEMSIKNLTLAPGEKYNNDNIVSFDIYFSSNKIKYQLRGLQTDSVVICAMVNDKFVVHKTDPIQPIFEKLF